MTRVLAFVLLAAGIFMLVHAPIVLIGLRSVTVDVPPGGYAWLFGEAAIGLALLVVAIALLRRRGGGTRGYRRVEM